MKICAFCPHGYDGYIVEVECDIHRGLPYFTIVGLPDSAVREARNRVRSAIISVGSVFPRGGVLISLSPGGVKKLGSGYDLAIAAAILYQSGQLRIPVPNEGNASCLFLGELGLNGRLKGAALDYAALLSPQAACFDRIILSDELMGLAAKLPLSGVALSSCASLVDLLKLSADSEIVQNSRGESIVSPLPPDENHNLVANPEVLRALEVSVSGFHNILLYGAPGSGKTAAARSLASLLPPGEQGMLSEQLRIHFRSIMFFQQQMRACSFREPHHSSSAEGILGGGKFLQPGEISLAHGGALLLDESPEFHRHVLQNLREPMETGNIHLIRADQASSYPCTAVFAFTMNLCPCGNRGRSDSLCMCSEGQIHHYWSRLGGALYDRIEIKKFCSSQGFAGFISLESDDYISMQKRILRSRERQKARYGSLTYNAYAPWQTIVSLPECNADVIQVLDTMQKQFFLSGRQRLNILRLALSILDLQDGDDLSDAHISEALSLMRPEEFNEYF